MKQGTIGENSVPSDSSHSSGSDEPGFSLRNVRVHEALARFGGDEKRLRHWLVEFVSHGPNAASQIRQAITGGSHDTAVKLTHAFKGRTGMLGMSELHSISQTLEMALRNGEPTLIWLEELESSVEEMSCQIESVLGKLPPDA